MSDKIAEDAVELTGAILEKRQLAYRNPDGATIIDDMMYAKAPWTVIRRAMHIHPTVYEMIPYMFDDLQPLD